MKPHPITPDLIPALYQLNQEHELELSSLTLDAFTTLIDTATYARSFGDGGMLLSFDQDADYHSVNIEWFRARYARFIYVDRIVVSPTYRGEGLARLFYEDLMQWALSKGHKRIVAEFNSDPLNVISEAFHNRMGFAPLGEAVLEGRGKSVRYVERSLAP